MSSRSSAIAVRWQSEKESSPYTELRFQVEDVYSLVQLGASLACAGVGLSASCGKQKLGFL